MAANRRRESDGGRGCVSKENACIRGKLVTEETDHYITHESCISDAAEQYSIRDTPFCNNTRFFSLYVVSQPLCGRHAWLHLLSRILAPPTMFCHLVHTYPIAHISPSTNSPSTVLPTCPSNLLLSLRHTMILNTLPHPLQQKSFHNRRSRLNNSMLVAPLHPHNSTAKCSPLAIRKHPEIDCHASTLDLAPGQLATTL